ncbi:MAG: phosphopantetheine-binding protein [Deltaproteobacteria bacterium]|jgi:acyl carrier protein|nr:phosphopantetheine-binding protein [Deltaproteobacteria bacterium]
MDRNYIVETVNKVLSEEFEKDIALFTPDAHIRDDLNLDSLDIVDMIIALEAAFKFKLKDRSKILEIATMSDVYDFIEKTYQAEISAR